MVTEEPSTAPSRKVVEGDEVMRGGGDGIPPKPRPTFFDRAVVEGEVELADNRSRAIEHQE